MRSNLLRSTVLTAAGLAFTGGAVAGPVTGALAADKPGAQVERKAERKGEKKRELDVRYEAQDTFFYCGPAAARNALSVQGKDIDQHDMAERMGTTEAGTDSINDITPVLNKETGRDVYRSVEISGRKADAEQTDKLRDDVIRSVDDGRALVANIAGTAIDTGGGVHSFEGGHYISVVGYRDGGEQVKIADSANPDTASYWMTTEALADWIATRGYATS
ncbi:C39 family peptidase [Micromonospora sp. WMMD558]|uniref:C39 family peptidase n=1 Tax=unclassified Micromonospora TaxID=2617518 RepID=UPI0012B4712C|nr:C39 family peptidase [Micromonospora sp. WMMC415]QGN45607.1 phytochelatin synthase [Micromonospora sp. WMMC415]QGN46494.1 phytochelatin synthase [Micromonospora sp. WMMC415]